jgi:HlyD family secretion protein
MFTPSNHIAQTTHRYLFQTSRTIFFLYFLIITVFTSIIAALPFLYVDISVVAPGIVRPSDERTEVKSAAAGFISALTYREGEFVPRNAILAALYQDHLTEKRLRLSDRIYQLRKYIADLKILPAAFTLVR